MAGQEEIPMEDTGRRHDFGTQLTNGEWLFVGVIKIYLKNQVVGLGATIL